VLRKSVLILVNVPDLQTVPQGITEEYVLANLDTQEIHMEWLAHQFLNLLLMRDVKWTEIVQAKRHALHKEEEESVLTHVLPSGHV